MSASRGGLLEKLTPVKDRSERVPQKSREVDAPRGNATTNLSVSRPAGERRATAPAHLRPLFDCWPEIAARVRVATDLRLFLDFDGTLVDFRSRPEQVSMGDEVRLTLGKLSRHKRVHIAMVSGRRRASLMQHVSVPRIEYFGLYGWEGEVPLRLSASTSRALARARVKLGELPNKAPGIYIEDKGMSLAVHFREASHQSQRCARAELHKWLAHFRSELHIIRASNVWEMAPRQIRGKGIAIKNMLAAVPAPFLPFYVGDDLTDESVFAALRDGVTVLVGPQRATNARFILRNSDEVCVFLQRLEAELS
jgi:trehalose 6-phosphate phosphatase